MARSGRHSNSRVTLPGTYVVWARVPGLETVKPELQAERIFEIQGC